MASIFDVISGLARKGNEAAQSTQAKTLVADVSKLAAEKKKKMATQQAAIDASIKKAGVKPSTISAPSSAPIDTGLSDLAQKAQSFPQLEGLLPSNKPVSVQNEETKNVIQNLFSRIKKPVVDMGASAIQNLNPIASLLNKTNVPALKNAADFVGNKEKISNFLSGSITGAVEQPASNLFESMQALRKKQEARTNTTMGDRFNDLLSSGTMTAGAAISALPIAAQYNAVVGGLKGNEQTKGLGEGIDAATMAIPNTIGAGINMIPGINQEGKDALSMLANIGLVTAGGKVGEGIGKRIDAGNLGRAASVVGKELTGNKATMFSGIDPTPFLKGVKEFAKNPIVQSLDPTGIAGGVGNDWLTQDMIEAQKINKPSFSDALFRISTELEVAEAGKRYTAGTFGGTDGVWTGYKSTFPSWIPSYLRKRPSLNKALKYIDEDMTLPPIRMPRIRELAIEVYKKAAEYSGDDNMVRKAAILEQEDINRVTSQKTIKKKIEAIPTIEVTSGSNAADTANIKKQDPLIEEAKKYKSAEEFANAKIKDKYGLIGSRNDINMGISTSVETANNNTKRQRAAEQKTINTLAKEGKIKTIKLGDGKLSPLSEKDWGIVRKNTPVTYKESVSNLDYNKIQSEYSSFINTYNKAQNESIKTENKPSKDVNDFNFNQNEFDAINEKIASAKNDAKNAEDAFYNNNRKPDEKSFTNNDFIEKTLATEKKGGWLSNMLQPAKNLPQDFQDALGNWKREKLLGQNRANTEAYSMKDSLAPIASKESILSKVMNNETSIGDAGKRFIKFMQNPTKEAAKKSGINFEESKKITDQFAGKFDNLRDEAINRGLDFGYIENYLPQLWKDAPQKVQEVFSKSASSKPFFSKERILEDYNTGLKMGLTPKYSHPAQLLGEYIKKMEDSLANKKLVDSLVEQKYIAPTDVANIDEVGKSWKIVEVPGLPSGGFKAPPEIQKVLHNIFGVTEVNGVLQLGADTSAFMQKSKLTGGVGTVNGFTVGQAFKEMALGMAHPIDTIKNVVTGKGTGLMNAFTRGMSKDASQKYFVDPVNSSAVKELSSHNIELNSPLDYKTMFQNAFEKNKGTSIKDKLVGSAKYSAQKVMDVVNHSDNDTFQQFMPILQVEFYKKAKDRLLKQGMGAEDAVKTASEQTKNFYGSVNYDLLGRSKNVQNALSTLFFAPRFREGILNVFNNTAKALTTELKNKSFAENRRLAAGVAITYGLYNALNYQLNGKPMWDNQSGWEGDLVVPQEDGTVIRVPFMPSFMTMPRNAFGVAKNLLGGDTKEAVKSASGFMSMPIQMGKQLLTNEDYFGNPIYTEQIGTNRKGETNTVLDKFKDQALYAGSGFTNSYLQSIIDYGRGKKTGIQAVTAALELPVKYGKQKDQTLEKGFETYINYIGLKNDIERLQKDNKDGSKKGEIDAKIQEMKDQAGALSEQDKLTYQGYRSGKLQPQGSDYDTMIEAKYGTTTVRGEATAAAQPVYDNLLKIKELSKDSQGNKEEIVRLFTDTKKAFDALSPYEKKNGFKYLLNKKAKTIEDKKKMIELSKKLFGYDDSQE